VGAFVALIVLLEAYGPSLRGPFLFDDNYLPFTAPEFADAPLRTWLAGQRPLLMFTFWVNTRLSGLEPFPYHLLNLGLHFLTGWLVWLIVRRLLDRVGAGAPVREILAAFAAGLFLLHPVQTESVAYVASRSETLSVMFFYAAFCWFLYRRREAIGWWESVGVLLLFGAGVTTKEHVAILPALLLLTDYFWTPGFSFQGIRRNWRLYLLIAAGGLLALRFVWRELAQSDTAGFAVKEVPWHQYFFTQCRVIWRYIRLFFLPYGQTIDYDLPVSRNLLEHGAIVGLLGLLALGILAFHYRRRYPLASYGLLSFLLLLAPTSSFVPIADPIAEHRLYLPMIGLLLVVVEGLRRWKVGAWGLGGTLAAVLVLAAGLCYQRNRVWGNEIALWEDAVAKSPGKSRAHFQLAYAYFQQGRCDAALKHYQTVAQLSKPDSRLLIDWAVAYDCQGLWQEAIGKLRQAAALTPTARVYSLMGMVFAKQGRRTEALDMLEIAAKLDPGYELTYIYRGNLFAAADEFEAAAEQYRQALRLNPRSEAAQKALDRIDNRLRSFR
jgi:tetratricopeptide (TPR) repeat protein